MKYVHHAIAALLGAIFAAGTMLALPAAVVAPIQTLLRIDAYAPAALAIGTVTAGHMLTALLLALATGLVILVTAILLSRTHDDPQLEEDRAPAMRVGDLMAFAEPAAARDDTDTVAEAPAVEPYPLVLELSNMAPDQPEAVTAQASAPDTAPAVAALAERIDALTTLVQLRLTREVPPAPTAPDATLNALRADIATLADTLRSQPAPVAVAAPAVVDVAQVQALFQPLADALRETTHKIDALAHRVDALMSRQAMIADQLARLPATPAQTAAATALQPAASESKPLRLPTSPRLTDTKTAKRLASALNELRKATRGHEDTPA